MHDLTEPETGLEAGLADRIDAAIAAGVRRGRAAAASRRRAKRARYAVAGAVCLLLAACLCTIRVSPAFASMLRDVPGLEKFVALIGGDRGLQSAVEHEFVQPVGISDAHDGQTFTIEGITVDDSRMVVFYELRNDGRMEPFYLERPELRDAQGASLPAFYSYDRGQEAQADGQNVVRGTLDIGLQDGLSWPDEVTLSVRSGALEERRQRTEPPAYQVGEDEPPPDDSGPTYRVRFAIDRAAFAGLKREYPIGRTLQIDGQRITIDKAVVSPLRLALYVTYDPDNTIQMFDTGDLHLVDDKGERWNSTGGTGTADGNTAIVYFESNFFHRPAHLRLEGSWFRALDKSKLQLVLNTDTGELLQAPDDRLALDSVAVAGADKKLTLSLSGVPSDDNMTYSLLEGSFRDAAGREYRIGDRTGSSSADEQGKQHMYFRIANQSYEQPLTFRLSNYPGYLRAPYRIPIW